MEFDALQVKKEYQKLQAYFSRLNAVGEGVVLTRREVLELYMAVATPLLNCIAESNSEVAAYLHQCLYRNLSFEDFWSIVITYPNRRSA